MADYDFDPSKWQLVQPKAASASTTPSIDYDTSKWAPAKVLPGYVAGSSTTASGQPLPPPTIAATGPNPDDPMAPYSYVKPGVGRVYIDPRQAQQEAAQPSAIQPADLIMFGGPALMEDVGGAMVKEGATSLISRPALTAAAKSIPKTIAGLAAPSVVSEGVHPYLRGMEESGPVGRAAGNILEAGAGILPFLAPGIGEATWRAATGQGEVAETATGAAQKAREAQAAEAETRAKATETRAGDVTEAAKTAKTELQARQAAARVTSPTEAARPGLPETEQKAGAKAQETYNKLHEKILKEAHTGAREETIQSTLGLGGVDDPYMEQSPERVQRGLNFRQYTLQPFQRWRADWAARRNAVLKDHLDKPVDDSLLRNRVIGQTQWTQTHAPYAPAVQKLLNEVMQSTPVTEAVADTRTDEQVLLAHGYSKKDIERGAFLPSYRASVVKTLREADAADAARTPGTGGQSVQKLIQTQERAVALSRQFKGNNPNRTALREVVRGVDDSLAQMDLPTLKKINAEYADHRRVVPYQFEDAIHNAAAPVDAAGQIFNDPERAADLARLSTPEERAQQLDLYRQWVAENGTKVINKNHAKFLQYYFPKGNPLTNPESWIYADRQINSLGEMFETSPLAKARFDKSIAKAQAEYDASVNDEIIKAAVKDSDPKIIGPQGVRIRRLMNAATTPEQKARIALEQFQQLNPDLAGQKAGNLAAQRVPRTAPDPNQAAVDAIMDFKARSHIWQRWKNRMWFTAPVGVGSVMARRTPTGLIGMTTIGLGIGLREWIAQGWRNSLRNPEDAARFYQAIMNPGVPKNLDYIANMSLRATAADQINRAGIQDPPDDDDDDSDPPSVPGPMSKAITRNQAVAMASPTSQQDPRHVDKLEKLNQQVASGKTPDIHHDLTGMRLSNTEIRKSLENEKVASIFGGMPLPAALDAFSRGTPREKETAFPSLVQKLNDEGRKLPPQQQQQMLAQLQRSMGGSDESAMT